MKAKVVRNISRPHGEVINKYKKLPTSIISDCMQRYGAMNATISSIFEGARLCGPAMTIQSMSGSNLMSHLALTIASKGDVLVIDARGAMGNAVWGGVQTVYAKKVGISGLVVDGAIRDVADIRREKFPVYCRGVTPAGPHKGWADSINVPIQCGGIPVSPGDLVLGDDDGIVVVPFSMIDVVLEEALERSKTEQKWLAAIDLGESSMKAVGLEKILANMDVEFLDE